MNAFPSKPLGHKSYGSIPHLPGSRQGRDDIGLQGGQARICLEKTRDAKDTIYVLEKLDGSNVSVAKISGEIVPLIRAGYPAVSSNWEQHRLFANWVFSNLDRFSFLVEGERACGEWLAQAHGTRYNLQHEPFAVFDIMHDGYVRTPWERLMIRVDGILPTPKLLHAGGAISIEKVDSLLGEFGHHNAIDKAEGAVWRVERDNSVDFLAKYVRHDKIDGKYLKDDLWNWRPEKK